MTFPIKVIIIAVLPFTVARTWLQCTHADFSLQGEAVCNQTSNWPYWENASKIGKEYKYTHTIPGQPLCSGGDPTSYGNELSPIVPTLRAGQSVKLIWAMDEGSFRSDYGNSTPDEMDWTGRFAYVWHAPDNDPSEQLFHTVPYAMFDWQNSEQRKFEYGKYFDIPGSVDKDNYGVGNLTLSEELESGLHTFIFAWNWVGSRYTDPLFDHVSCFQYNIINDKADSSIKVSHAMPSPTWTPVYTHKIGDTFTPMTGLMQTLDAKPITMTRANGQPFTAFMRSASNFAGAGDATQTQTPTAAQQTKISTTMAKGTPLRLVFDSVVPARYYSLYSACSFNRDPSGYWTEFREM